MISRTFASVFPRQSPSSLIFASMNAEADSTGIVLFMYRSNSPTYFHRARSNLQPPASSPHLKPPQDRVPHVSLLRHGFSQRRDFFGQPSTRLLITNQTRRHSLS